MELAAKTPALFVGMHHDEPDIGDLTVGVAEQDIRKGEKVRSVPQADPALGRRIEAGRDNYLCAEGVRGSAELDGRSLSPKAFRHTAASIAIAAGADVKVVQRMLVHADASVTLKTYADLWPDLLDEVINAVSEHREGPGHLPIMTSPGFSPRHATGDRSLTWLFGTPPGT